MATVAIEIALPRDELRRLRRVLLVTGTLAVLAGATAIVVPAVASVAIAVLVGWLLMLAGALDGAYARSTATCPAAGGASRWPCRPGSSADGLVAFPLACMFDVDRLLRRGSSLRLSTSSGAWGDRRGLGRCSTASSCSSSAALLLAYLVELRQ